MSQRGIIWLASYPKSGNTWVRCLISSLQTGAAEVDLDRLGKSLPPAASRDWLEQFVDVDSSDLTSSELHLLRNSAYRQCAAQSLELLKVHDRYDPTLFPADATLATIYIVRDPRDIAPSWADQMSMDVDAAISQMRDSRMTMSRMGRSFYTQTPQWYGSWSGHVASWLQQAPGPRLILHYEDLLAQPLRETTRLATFLGLPSGSSHVARAVAASHFETLRSIEDRRGFAERRREQTRFFRQGRAGAWRSALTPEQAQRVASDHGVVMDWLGYR
ncbi:sulfotransferase domain-containing protein [Xanthomonas arboricola]|uniref:Aryl sulfotransferase n=1 Tax=Xanthomonas arboricola pv. guizotiae TaxID=487867 RepID=A0A2S7A1R0_9XANT|nr:sulfotransferase domain-containing protein [Xanthomonas arboricola]PPT99675.1 aryl sulfotransferase [Xanthomonas arboricola pv. guizotiae]PPU22733.1 aryl sulfotransferase [Xanthomonas arboricola pv. guizotiae]